MFLSEEKAIAVLRKVAQVQEETRAYVIAPDRPDLPIEAFQHIVGKMYGLQIKKELVDFDSTFLQGLIERYHDRAVIYVKKSMPWNSIRFTSVKEICHIVVDEKEDWSIDGGQTISDLLTEFFLEDPDDVVSEDGSIVEAKVHTQSELFAEIAATELLYPLGFRENDRQQLENKNITLSKISTYHQVPEHVVGRALSKQYDEQIRELWKKAL